MLEERQSVSVSLRFDGQVLEPPPALALLFNRRSVPPRLLTDPAPTGPDLEIILAAACRAPDHGALRPWRFIVIRDKARERLGAVFAEARRQRDAAASPQDLEAERRKPLRAPLVLAVAAVVSEEHPSVRAVDQVLATGCAAHGVLLAAQALGYGGIWLTGSNCHDPNVKAALGLAPKDAIVGYLYLGTPSAEPPPRPRPDPATLIIPWTHDMRRPP